MGSGLQPYTGGRSTPRAGDPFRVDVPLFVPIRGYCAPPVIERRRFQRLGGTIADNHFKIQVPATPVGVNHYSQGFTPPIRRELSDRTSAQRKGTTCYMSLFFVCGHINSENPCTEVHNDISLRRTHHRDITDELTSRYHDASPYHHFRDSITFRLTILLTKSYGTNETFITQAQQLEAVDIAHATARRGRKSDVGRNYNIHIHF